MIKNEEMTRRAKKGIEFLNKTYGKRWRRKVNLKTLNLRDCYFCILGQTDSSFLDHKKQLQLSEKQVVQKGFLLHLSDFGLDPTDYIGIDKVYRRLTNVWKKLLKEK